MISSETKFHVADNSGASKVKCIHVNGSTGFFKASVGDVVMVSIRSCVPNGKLKKGQKFRAVIVRTVKPKSRKDGTSVRFDDNAVVLIDAKSRDPIGTRVLGAVAREVRAVSSKITSLAEEVL